MRVESSGGRRVVSQDSQGDIDFAALGRALWAKRRWLIGPAVIAAALSIVAVNVVTPRYKSETRILIEGRENAFLRPEAEKALLDRTQVDQEAVASQVQILMSRDLASQVIHTLKLGERPEFDPVVKGVSPVTVLLSLFGLAKDPLRMTPEERVLQSYFDRLAVTPVEKSRVIIVEFQSADPELAAQIANTIGDAYLVFQQNAKQQQTRNASQWLAVEIDKLRPKVEEADRKVEEFRAKTNLYVGTNNTSLANQQLTDMTTQLAAARAQKAELEAKARLIREMLKTGKPVESNDITNSELLRRLVEQRVTLRAQLAEQSSTLLGLHPRIQELNAQINALDVQIRGELEKVGRSIENDARIAGARVEQTVGALEQLKRQIASSSGQDVDLRALEREAKAQRDLLESYLAKYREATARDSIDAAPADARVISRALVSNVPVFPKKLPIVLVAALATLALSATWIVTAELLGGGATVPAFASRPVPAATKPGSRFNPFRRKAKNGKKPAAGKELPLDAEAAPLTGLARTLGALGDAARRITVIGAARNVGTTYTALGLARALAANSRVVLVDLALASPNISIMSTNPGAPGVAELVQGAASFAEVITRDRFSRSHLIATGKVSSDPAAILASPRLAATLEALARSYDHVVIDAGAVADAAVDTFARLAPRAVLVATDARHPDTIAARKRLIGAGFTDVTVFVGSPDSASAAA
jgi:uncharacterized protein involved in exopolysaccharide biosynthesis/Mrp family chromosome partitioning ATPase